MVPPSCLCKCGVPGLECGCMDGVCGVFFDGRGGRLSSKSGLHGVLIGITPGVFTGVNRCV